MKPIYIVMFMSVIVAFVVGLITQSPGWGFGVLGLGAILTIIVGKKK